MNANTRTIQRRKDCCAIFAAGAIIYTGAELLWRGHSHWTMTLTGGACALAIHLVNRRMRSKSLWLRGLAGCAIITSAEFSVGCLVNRLLGWGVWDYSSMRYNLLGQVCLLYSAMWYLMSLPAFGLSSWIDSRRSDGHIVFV